MESKRKMIAEQFQQEKISREGKTNECDPEKQLR